MTYFSILYLCLVIKPARCYGQVVVYFLKLHLTENFSWLVDFRCKKKTVSYHKLCVDLIYRYIVGEFIPHRSHQRLSCNAHLIESSVYIVDKVVALINSGLNHTLNSLSLKPRFSIGEVNSRVGSEEWIKSSKLVELYKKIICCLTVESWNVRTSKWMASDTEL